MYLVGGLDESDHDFFPYMEWNNHPNWRTHMFQRGRYTTQPDGIWDKASSIHRPMVTASSILERRLDRLDGSDVYLE